MALRAEPSGGSQAIAGLPTYWQDASKNPTLEWEKWRDLFEVALMAKNNISIAELTKTGSKDKSLMGDLDDTSHKESYKRTLPCSGIGTTKINC